NQNTPGNVGGFAFELQYDGVKQELKPIAGKQGSSMPEYETATPNVGAKVTMYTTRMDSSSGKMGLLLLVNGLSSWQREKGDPMGLRRWIYGPTSKKEEYKGFYMDLAGKNLLPFKVLTEKESLEKAGEFGEHAGWIHVHVFSSNDGQVQNKN